MPGTSATAHLLRRLPFVAVGLLVVALLIPAHAGAIANGRAALRAYPHQALVEVEQGAFCGGNLVASRYVVTAGHCVTDSGGAQVAADRLRVGVGDARRSLLTAEKSYRVTRAIRHERYDDGLQTNNAPDFDVAVLVLDRPAPQPPLALPSPGQGALWAPGVRGTVLGWGELSDRSRPDELHEAQVTLRANADCVSMFAPLTPPNGRNPFAAATMLCAGGPDGGATCQGDSGGPLLVPDGSRTVLAGITSWGYEQCDDVRYANVFARVGEGTLADWLRDHLPRADFTIGPAEPDPGQPVTLTSTSRSPSGAFTRLQWDLDGDGEYDDANGATATHAFAAAGRHTVGLRAANDEGDAEVARRDVEVRPHTAVRLEPASLRVREGQREPAAVRVARAGGGRGRVGLAVGGSAAGGRDYLALPSGLDVDDADRPLDLLPVNDDRDEPSETVEIALERPDGGLFLGAPARATITIVDDDLNARVVRWQVRRGRISVRARVRDAGELTAQAVGIRSRRTLARARVRARRAGGVTLRLRLTRAGRRAVAGRRRARARIVVSYAGGGERRQAVKSGTLR